MYRCSACGAFNRVAEGHTGEPICGRCKRPLDTSGAPQAVNAEALARAAASSPVPVVVDVWAPWCPPCRAVSPVLDQIAKERRGKVVVLKVNSDESPLPHLGIQAIPTFLIYKGGREIDRKSGALPKHLLDAWIAESAAAG
ncbi:MAG: thiol reductase thioredoxin [Myxococcaceae bacterium]|nr:thiol reductase thioredoxin [Myxococcaceae bacterium]